MRKELKTMINEMIIGEKLDNCFLVMCGILESNEGYTLNLKDKSGEIHGLLRKELFSPELKGYVGGVVKLSAVVKPSKGRVPELNIKSIEIADTSEYNPLDLFEGLSKEKIDEYVTILRICTSQIKHPGYKQLAETLLTEENLQKLASVPASLAYYGRYKGGALAGAANITIMARDVGIEYVKHFNGLNTRTIDWSLILTASVLNTIGVLSYITPIEPFKKSPLGVEKGYVGCTQSLIERTVLQNDIPLTELEVARLLNVLTSAVALKTCVKATTKEGIILRHVVALYAELDMLDFGVATHEKEEEDEPYFYSPSLKRYISS
jgi:hypothetical protein